MYSELTSVELPNKYIRILIQFITLIILVNSGINEQISTLNAHIVLVLNKNKICVTNLCKTKKSGLQWQYGTFFVFLDKLAIIQMEKSNFDKGNGVR